MLSSLDIPLTILFMEIEVEILWGARRSEIEVVQPFKFYFVSIDSNN